jgi:hypothetical protein
MVYSRAREEFSSAYIDKDVPNKTIHRLSKSNFGTQEVSVCDKCTSGDKTSEITAVLTFVSSF